MAEKDDWKKQLPYIGEYELGIHKTPVKKLADILASCTIRQLKSFFYSYNVTNKDIPSKKAELVSAAVKLITENCAQFLMYAGGINFDFYKQYLNCRNTETGVCNADLYAPDPKDYEDESEIFMYIMKSGLVKIFLQKGLLFKFDVRNGDELFVIPDEVYDEVTTHIKKDGTHPFGSMYACKEFADTLLSLYGVLTVRDFKILWETAFPEQKMTREEIIEFMKFSSRDDDVYNFHEKLPCCFILLRGIFLCRIHFVTPPIFFHRASARSFRPSRLISAFGVKLRVSSSARTFAVTIRSAEVFEFWRAGFVFVKDCANTSTSSVFSWAVFSKSLNLSAGLTAF